MYGTFRYIPFVSSLHSSALNFVSIRFYHLHLSLTVTFLALRCYRATSSDSAHRCTLIVNFKFLSTTLNSIPSFNHHYVDIHDFISLSLSPDLSDTTKPSMFTVWLANYLLVLMLVLIAISVVIMPTFTFDAGQLITLTFLSEYTQILHPVTFALKIGFRLRFTIGLFVS